jgi:two-component system chemotaxis sensor kinase CheA
MLTLKRSDLFTAEGHEMVMLQERPLPVVSLASLLGLDSAPAGEEITLLALAIGDRAMAFEIEALYSERELVLKPIGSEIAGAQYVSGAAILGTGEVLIVLDANDLIRGASGTPLPRRSAAAAMAAQLAERRPRVLIVDDSITTRTLEKHILETAGYEVYVAIDGVEAWDVLDEVELDVVIADVEMPRMDGLELTRQIKERAATQHLPVILLTSLSKPEQREAGLRAGADAYLIKSRFDQGELLRVVEAVL